MKIYIAGPVTGKINYFDSFKQAVEEICGMGAHIIINPSFLPDGLNDYMPICKAMIDQADAIYVQEGWEDSAGTKEEINYAFENDKKIFMQRDVRAARKR